VHFFTGIAAFCLFFLGDWNDWKWRSAPLRACFPAGAALLTASAVGLALQGQPPLPAPFCWLFYLPAAAFLLLLVRTLFFALDPRDAYVLQGEKRPVCTRGVYALCRHPGVLWLAGVYASLWAAAGLPLAAGVLFSALNVLLVWFEDAKVFPARLAGYGAYRRTTPFLLPNRRSVRAYRESL
jgi:protein-S-isoprenylcysteine O-methyltransferase Ste14